MLRIDGNSTTAVKALKDVETAGKSTAAQTTTLNGTLQTMVSKYGSLAASVGVVGSAALIAKGAFDQFQTAQKASADLFSQFGERGWEAAAAANRITDAADNMIKIQSAASAANRLMYGDLKLTEETVQNLAKMAVDMGRKFGKSADEMMDSLSNAIAGGDLGALRQYGIILEESTANLKANKIAMEEHGRVASKTEKKNQKAAMIAAEVDKRYKDVIITVGDVNEIEAKYTNTKQKNLALVAKTMERTAMSIQSVKHAFADAKQEIIGLLNGMDKLDERALVALRKGLENAAWEASGIVQEQLGKNLTDRSWEGIADAMKRDAADLARTLDTYRKHRAVTTEEEAKQLQGQILDRERLAKQAEDQVKATETAIRLQKANLKEQGSAQTKVMQERRKIIWEEISGLEKTLEQQKKRSDMQKEILEKQKDLVAQYGLTESMSASDRMLQNLFNYGQESAAQLKVQQALADNFVATIQKKGKIEEADKKTAAERITLLSQEWQQKERAIQQLEMEVEQTEDVVKKKKVIGIEERARLERQKRAAQEPEGRADRDERPHRHFAEHRLRHLPAPEGGRGTHWPGPRLGGRVPAHSGGHQTGQRRRGGRDPTGVRHDRPRRHPEGAEGEERRGPAAREEVPGGPQKTPGRGLHPRDRSRQGRDRRIRKGPEGLPGDSRQAIRRGEGRGREALRAQGN